MRDSSRLDQVSMNFSLFNQTLSEDTRIGLLSHQRIEDLERNTTEVFIRLMASLLPDGDVSDVLSRNSVLELISSRIENSFVSLSNFERRAQLSSLNLSIISTRLYGVQIHYQNLTVDLNDLSSILASHQVRIYDISSDSERSL